MLYMNKTAYLLLPTLFFTFLSSSQTSRDFEKYADSLLKVWDHTNSPGVATGVLKDGKIIYLKGFGAAHLETREPITAKTKFQLGEMSKQFTSLALLLLEQKGEITLEEDIRTYLSELPEYKHIVTIGHLLNHSSGLYDVTRISNVVHGTTEIRTQAKALELIAAQQTLSFVPGTDFSFHESPTESILMAEIVARVSKQSFATFVKTNIFEPLGMKNSLIRDDSNVLLAHVAEAYQKGEDNVYRKLAVPSSVVGAINAYSSAEDLAKWYLNFTDPTNDLGRLVQKLDEPVQLANGEPFVYYWGEMAIGREFTHPERGLPIFWNFGFQGGYGTNVFRYLDQNIISFVLGNNNEYNGALAQTAIVPFVKDLYPLPANIDFKAKEIKQLSTEQLNTFEGDYWFREGYASQLFVKNDTLRSKWLFGESYQTLVPLSENTFQQYAEMEDTRLFKFKKEDDRMILSFTYNESRPDVMERYEPPTLSAQDLAAYTGTYYNEAYATLFTFRIEENQLVARNLNHRDIHFRAINKEVFTSTSMFFNALEFLRDKTGKIKGFDMVTDGIHHLVFEKVR